MQFAGICTQPTLWRVSGGSHGFGIYDGHDASIYIICFYIYTVNFGYYTHWPFKCVPICCNVRWICSLYYAWQSKMMTAKSQCLIFLIVHICRRSEKMLWNGLTYKFDCLAISSFFALCKFQFNLLVYFVVEFCLVISSS